MSDRAAERSAGRATDLLVAGNAVRYLSESASRAGYRVTAVDAYADLDTRAAARHVTRLARCRPETLCDAVLENAERCAPAVGARPPLLLGAGLEGRPDLVAQLARRCTLLGNPAAVWALQADPSRFLALLDALDIPYPETRRMRPAGASEWLYKVPGNCGGNGVYGATGAEPPATGGYWQRRVSGPALSVTFAAAAGRVRVLGFNHLHKVATTERPFLYGGAVNRMALPAMQREPILTYVSRLARALQLVGVNGLDLVLDDGQPLVLELNPRPVATLELYEPDLPQGGAVLHLQACAGELPERQMSGARVRGVRVLYARVGGRVPAFPWPDWARDRPAPGTTYQAGDPLCSVHAEAATETRVRDRLAERTAELRRRFAVDVEVAA